MATATVAQSGTVSVLALPTTQVSLKRKAKEHQVKPIASLVAGALAGAIEAGSTYPLEYAKTRSQLNTGRIHSSTTSKPLSALLQIVHREGLRTIYTGCPTLVVGTACKVGVRFVSYDSIKNVLADSNGKLSAGGGIIAGMAAGALESVVVVTPSERIKTALIEDARRTKRYNGGSHAMRMLIAERGVRNLFRGLLSTTIKQSSISAVRMGCYNVFRDFIDSTSHFKGTQSSVVAFATGAAVGVVTVYATQPFDTIKTRVQATHETTTMDAVRQLFRDGGLRAFWSGSSMRFWRLVISSGITFSVYERVVAILK